jgi:5-methyltetrahydrofolate--homocysteine methyltransferase
VHTAERPFPLSLKPDAEEAQQRMRAYWAGELIDRPCVSVRAPRAGITPPWRSLICRDDFDFARMIAEFEEWAAALDFGGEAMPALMPNWGPDQWAGCLGAPLTLVPEQDTSWAEPVVDDWDALPALRIDPQNRWWRAAQGLTEAAACAGAGRFIVSTIDTHSNLDCLAALRGPERLCLDLVERPDAVRRMLEAVDTLYEPVYKTLYRLGRMREYGTTSWLDMWSPQRSQAVQCDFSCMISPDHFRRFALPYLEREIARLDHAVYHMDGPGQIRHLEALLGLERLHTIQWVPGAGQPPTPAWIEMLQHIQQAGKSVQVLVTVDEVKQLHSQLAPQKTFYWVLDCPNENAARDLLAWLRRHT